jgi:hypothetical protein
MLFAAGGIAMSPGLLRRPARTGLFLALGSAVVLGAGVVSARQSGRPSPAQKIDQAYTQKILDSTPDKRILTELVDHMPLPADPKIPSPLKFFGYVPGENNMLTYHKDIVRYLDALQKASPRVKLWTIGQTEEGRDMVACAIADEATIRNLQHFKDITGQLTDPRKTSDAVARQLIAAGKPIYYVSGSIHTPETGSPEMLTELAYRLAIEESPCSRRPQRWTAGRRWWMASARCTRGRRAQGSRTGAITCSTTTIATASARASP